METTLFIARILFPTAATLTISIFLAPTRYQEITTDIRKSPSMTHLGSVISLLLGTRILVTHRDFTRRQPLFITLLGLASLLKGVLPLLTPRTTERLLRKNPPTRSHILLGAAACAVATILLALIIFA